MEQKTSKASLSPTSASDQRQLKSRSKSIEETQHSKRTIASQKSLPGRPELERVKEIPDETPTASIEELK